MDIDVVIEMLKNNRVLWVSATVTGCFTVLITLINIVLWFFQQRKLHTNEKDLQSFKHEYDIKLEDWKKEFSIEIERHKSVLEKKNHISQVRFNFEFQLHRELSVACRNMVNDTYFLYPTFAQVPADKDVKEEYEKRVYRKACESYEAFHTLLTSNASFITKEIYDQYFSLMMACKDNFGVFESKFDVFIKTWWDDSLDKREAEREAYKNTREIVKLHKQIVDEIRLYLQSLEIRD